MYEGAKSVELKRWSYRYWEWLTEAALPLWVDAGIDKKKGGFQELLGLDGGALEVPRRARVQGRQSFVFALAGKLGWDGPWRGAARAGLDWLERHARRPDGLYATLMAPNGVVLDHTAMTYDQAFALLAAAALHEHSMGPGEDYALGLLGKLGMLRRHTAGGFLEADGKFLSNPHMHLFESALAWVEAGGGDAWRRLAAELAGMALDRFMVDGGPLREVFDADWAPAPGQEGQVVEPGHQFEWAWLLARWANISGDARALVAAQLLYAAGLRGIDEGRGVAVDRTDIHMVPLRTTARLWPQTEWLKAACLLGSPADVEAAAAALWRYLETSQDGMKAGLWRDKMREDGTLVDEPAPGQFAISYHLRGRVAEGLWVLTWLPSFQLCFPAASARGCGRCRVSPAPSSFWRLRVPAR